MPVSLPSDDPDPAARDAERTLARDTYRYTWHQPEGVASAAEVPSGDGFDAGYLARYAEVLVGLKAHELAVAAANRMAHVEEATRAPGGLLERMANAVEGALSDGDRRATPEVTLRWFGDEVPAFVQLRHDRPAQSDLLFAWQRLGGANPMSLRHAPALPEGFALSAERFTDAVAAAGAVDSLEAALAEGRLFVADWSALAGARTGVTKDGLAKRLYGPRALFVQTPRALLPVAIECDRGAAPLVPGDGAAWTIAKLIAQAADAHEQALVWHVGHCHFLMEAFTLATRRELARAHPVRCLLEPHMEYTLAINAQVRDTLMKPGGDLEKLLAMTLGESLVRVSAAMAGFDYAAVIPPSNVAARGLDDASRLPECPLRDDGLAFWNAIHRFVTAYLALYYASDEAVASDAELRAWTAELRSHWGGRLRTIPDVADRAALAELVSFVLWTAGPFHTICNYAQLEYMSDSTSMPLALFEDPPRSGATDADLYAQYTPEGLSLSQYAFFFEQTQLAESRFGRYPPGTFEDPRVEPLALAFGLALDAVDAGIEAKNLERPAAYEWLRPIHTRGSIHS